MQWRSARFLRYLWRKQPFYSTVGVHIFSTAGVGTTLPILVRLKLPLPDNTAVILQQSTLLQARRSPFRAVGGNYLVRGVILPVFCTVGARTYTVLPPPVPLWGHMLPVFIRLAARFFTVLPPPPLHWCWGRCCPFLYGSSVGAEAQ